MRKTIQDCRHSANWCHLDICYTRVGEKNLGKLRNYAGLRLAQIDIKLKSFQAKRKDEVTNAII